MPRYIERRAGGRVAFKSPVKIKNLKTGAFCNARMVNYCDSGLNFESDSILDVGTEIMLGIENSPYSKGFDAFDVYRAKILWRKPIHSTFYNYGYGARLRSSRQDDSLPVNGKVDMRKYPRRNCRLSVCFFSLSQPHQGVVKNFCPNGLFIETRKSFSVGQTIEMTVTDRKTDKLKLLSGEIVRLDPAGVGVRLRNRSVTNGENPI